MLVGCLVGSLVPAMRFMITYIYYAHLAFVRFNHSVCRGSLMKFCCSEVVGVYQAKKIVTNVLHKVFQNFSEMLPLESCVKLL